MPVARHRRRAEPAKPPSVRRRQVATIDELRQIIADPGLDFAGKTTIAAVWWFRQLLRKVGERRVVLPSKKDATRAALLLCMAMDGEHGENDDVAPVIAEMLRPWRRADSFAVAWELAHGLPRGSVATQAARILATMGRKPAGPDATGAV